MKVLIQWATATVNDWVEYDINSAADIRSMPRKPVPSDSPVIDDDEGWIAAVNVQGVTLQADHIGFALDGNGHLVVGKWNDDEADWAGVPFGWLYTFGPLAPDPNLPATPGYALLHPERVGQIDGQNYKINTQQTVTRHADISTLTALVADGEPWAQRWLDDPGLRPWSEFRKFTPNNQLHGVWLEQPLMDALDSARSVRGWREWGAQ